MKIQIKKWGNSASVRIPASVMAAADLVLDQAVDVREQDGCVIIQPIATAKYDLAMLLDQMAPDTFPDEIDFGAPVGREIW